MKQEYFRDYWAHLQKLYTECNKVLSNYVRAMWFDFGRGEKMVEGKLVSFDILLKCG